MRILGIGPFTHDTAAALLEDGVVKAAIENDKIVRHPTHGLPEAAIRLCLTAAELAWRDLDAVALATRPVRGWLRRASLPPLTIRSAAYYQTNEAGRLAREANDFRRLKQHCASSCKLLRFDHHESHAANSYFQSSFDQALILTLDEDGDGVSGMVARGEGRQIRVLKRISFRDSLAWLYSRVTELIGFRAHRDEHKTQWLSLEGEPIFKDLFLDMLRPAGRGVLPRLNYHFFEYNVEAQPVFSTKFYRALRARGTAELTSEHARALASSIQQACTEIISDLLSHFLEKEHLVHICLGGGLFQNSLLIAELEDKFGLGRVFVPPAPGNPGSAIGAGLLAWHRLSQQPRLPASRVVFSGPRFNHQEIKEVLDNAKVKYVLQETEVRKLDAAIDLLLAGKIVGWYQGAAEFGPRALGNRSVLASPWAPYVKENLNDYIKHREWFRPFALAIPAEDCSRYFLASSLCGNMNSLARVNKGCEDTLNGFLLPGGRIRLQTVERANNPLFWHLLRRIGERSIAPILLNTSFNLFGEPLVVTPREALRSYFSSGIDALVIDNFVLSKRPASPPVAAAMELGSQVHA